MIESDKWTLPGTLTLPKGDGIFPAVVLAHGSGPGDRDETIGPNKPFRDLAHGLADRGLAVLRYDKRTKVYGVMVYVADAFTVRDETIDDALAAVDLLRRTNSIDSPPNEPFSKRFPATIGSKSKAGRLNGDPSKKGVLKLAGMSIISFQ